MNKLNILIVSHSFPPYMNVGGMRAYSWAKYWSEAGHKVTVLTSKSRINFSYTSTFKIEVLEGIEIIEIENPLFKYFNANNAVSTSQSSNNRNTIRKLVRKIFSLLKNNLPVADYYFDWYFKSTLYIKKNRMKFSKFDFVISTANPLSAHSIGMFLKEKLDLKWVADYRDLEEQSKLNRDIGYLRRWYINNFKNKILKASDLDLTVSKGLKDILLTYQNKNEVKVIYNGFFEENYLNMPNSNLEWKIIYSGSYYEKQFDIRPLFQALDLLMDNTTIPIPEIVFYGSYSEYTKKCILKSGSSKVVKKVVFKPSVSNTEIAKLQSSSAILLLIDNLDSKGVLLTKSYEYLAAQRPIIAIVNPQSELATKFLNDKSAYCVGSNPIEIKEFIEAIHKDINEQDALKSLNYYDIDKLKFYTRKSQAIILLEHIKKVINT